MVAVVLAKKEVITPPGLIVEQLHILELWLAMMTMMIMMMMMVVVVVVVVMG